MEEAYLLLKQVAPARRATKSRPAAGPIYTSSANGGAAPSMPTGKTLYELFKCVGILEEVKGMGGAQSVRMFSATGLACLSPPRCTWQICKPLLSFPHLDPPLLPLLLHPSPQPLRQGTPRGKVPGTPPHRPG